MKPASKSVLQALAVTAELTGTQLSEAAARVFAADLAQYPEQQVLAALTRCRREVKGRLTPGDVIGRLDDGRPTPDEAWAMLPQDEMQTVVMTQDMAEAWGIARQADDRVGARMAFLTAYRRIVQQARDAHVPVKWFSSLGHDPLGREAAIEEAVRLGRLSPPHAAGLLPSPNAALHPDIAAIAVQTLARLTGPK